MRSISDETQDKFEIERSLKEKLSLFLFRDNVPKTKERIMYSNLVYMMHYRDTCSLCEANIAYDKKTKRYYYTSEIQYFDDLRVYFQHLKEEHKEHNYAIAMAQELIIIQNYGYQCKKYGNNTEKFAEARLQMGRHFLKIMKDFDIPLIVLSGYYTWDKRKVGALIENVYANMDKELLPKWMRSFY